MPQFVVAWAAWYAGQLVGHVPAHAQDNDLLVEVAALEHRMGATTNHGDLRRGGLPGLPGGRCNRTIPVELRELTRRMARR